MKMGTIIAFFSVVLATTNAKVAVGETIAELIARYGEPENGGVELTLGYGAWKTKQVASAFFTLPAALGAGR